MKERINKRELPPLKIIDMTNEIRDGNTGVFSYALKQALIKTVSEGNQAMLFINRRGFSSFLMCKKCGWVAKCDACEAKIQSRNGLSGIYRHNFCPCCGAEMEEKE